RATHPHSRTQRAQKRAKDAREHQDFLCALCVRRCKKGAQLALRPTSLCCFPFSLVKSCLCDRGTRFLTSSRKAQVRPLSGLTGQRLAPTTTLTMRSGSSLRANAARISAAVTFSTCLVQVSR